MMKRKEEKREIDRFELLQTGLVISCIVLWVGIVFTSILTNPDASTPHWSIPPVPRPEPQQVETEYLEETEIEPAQPQEEKPQPPALIAFSDLPAPTNGITTLLAFDGEDPEYPNCRLFPKDQPPVYTNGILDQALLFTSHKQYLSLLPEAFREEGGTIAFWIHLDHPPKHTINLLTPRSGNGPQIRWDGELARWEASLGEGTVRCRLPAMSPADEGWHHLAFSWDADARLLSLYYDGNLWGPYAQLHMLEFPPFDLLSATFSAPNALDDFRIYNRPLDPLEVRALVQKNFPFALDWNNTPLRQRIVTAAPETQATFTAQLRSVSTQKIEATLLLETLENTTNIVWSTTLKTELPAGANKPLSWVIPMGTNSAPVRLQATLLDQQASPGWSTTIFRRTPSTTPQKETTPRRVVFVDCTATTDSKNFLSLYPTTLGRSEAGAYRETSTNHLDWMAYRFNIKTPNIPHLLTVNYPDTQPQIISFDIADGSGDPLQGAGILSGWAAPLTEKMRSTKIVFTPKTTHCALFICNWISGGTAAISSFEVHEMGNSTLPALEIPAKTTPSRYWGRYISESTLPGLSSLTPSLANWNEALNQLADFMAFNGQNLLEYPVVWDDGPLFPSPTNDRFTEPSYRRAAHPDGTFDLLFSILEKQNIHFAPIFRFREMAALRYPTDLQPPQESPVFLDGDEWLQRHKGRPPVSPDAMFQIYKDGSTRPAWLKLDEAREEWSIGNVYNPLHPAVQAVLRGTIQDWLNLYGNQPALNAIVLDLGASWEGCPGGDALSFNRLDAGYGDNTIEKFEQETGIKIPENPAITNRFEARYAFLTAPEMREKWIDWRCKKIRDEVILPIAEEVWKKRPDLRIILAVGSRESQGSPLLNNAVTVQEAARECGIDFNLYTKIPKIEIQRHPPEIQTPERGYPQNNFDTSFPPTPPPSGIVAANNAYWKTKGTLYQNAANHWPEVRPTATQPRSITDAGMAFFRDALIGLLKNDISTLLTTGPGRGALPGHHPEIAAFARAFLSLPAQLTFQQVGHFSDPAVVRQAQLGTTNFSYLVNASADPLAIQLFFETPSTPLQLIDLSTGKPLAVNQENQLTLTLPGYSFKALQANTPLKHAKLLIPKKQIARLQTRLARLTAQLRSYKNIGKRKKNGVYIPLQASAYAPTATNQNLTTSRTAYADLPHLNQFLSPNETDLVIAKPGIVSYSINVPNSAKYDLWIRYTFLETFKSDCTWTLLVDQQDAGYFITQRDEKEKARLWRKVATLPLEKGTHLLSLSPATLAPFSPPLNMLLLTDDLDYLPATPHEEQITHILQQLPSLIQAQRFVRAHALLAILQKEIEIQELHSD